jgi:hypothetical protein
MRMGEEKRKWKRGREGERGKKEEKTDFFQKSR